MENNTLDRGPDFQEGYVPPEEMQSPTKKKKKKTKNPMSASANFVKDLINKNVNFGQSNNTKSNLIERPKTTIETRPKDQQQQSAQEDVASWTSKWLTPYSESGAVANAQSLYDKSKEIDPDTKAYLDKLLASTSGYTGQQYQDLQEQYLRATANAEQNAQRQLKAQQGQYGVRGGLASAQAANISRDTALARTQAEQDLRIKNIDEIQKRIETYGTERQKVVADQFAREAQANKLYFDEKQKDINDYYERSMGAIKIEMDKADKDRDFQYREDLNNKLLELWSERDKTLKELGKQALEYSQKDYENILNLFPGVGGSQNFETIQPIGSSYQTPVSNR